MADDAERSRQEQLIKIAETTKDDLYALLGIDPTKSEESDIKSAFRKSSLKCHPDKHPDAEHVKQFHQLQLARDVLLEPKAKKAYDAARQRKAERAQTKQERSQRAQELNPKLRSYREDLQRREAAFQRDRKRKRAEEDAARVRDECERQQDAERRRKEAERLAQEKELQQQQAAENQQQADDDSSLGLDRTVKVRWIKGEQAAELSQAELRNMFSSFGPVEHIVWGKEVKIKSRSEKRKLALVAYVMYDSITAAQQAVREAPRDSRVVDVSPRKAASSSAPAPNGTQHTTSHVPPHNASNEPAAAESVPGPGDPPTVSSAPLFAPPVPSLKSTLARLQQAQRLKEAQQQQATG